LAVDFRAACDLHGFTYRVHAGLWQAVRAHTRWLREMGRPPTASGSVTEATLVPSH
jgi:hypothetical protein